MNQVAVKHAVGLQAVCGYCLTVVQSFVMYSVGKCGVVQLALCGGCNGELYCLWQANEIDNVTRFSGIDKLITCKENEMCVEILIDFQFIRNVIRRIIRRIIVIIKSYYCFQLFSYGFPASFCIIFVCKWNYYNIFMLGLKYRSTTDNILCIGLTLARKA